MDSLSYIEWGFAFFAAFILGVSKCGLKGVAIIAVSIMALLFGSKASTGIIMPHLIVGDLFAIIYYRKHVEWKHLKKLLPYVILGVLVGVFVGNDISDDLFKKGMSVIIIVTVCIISFGMYKKIKKVPNNRFFSISIGLLTGFTTMVGNLAGAFSNLYFLAMRLPKNQFIGTSAWLFFFVNWFKIPFHIFTWKTITLETLKINGYLLIAEVLGLLIGIYIVKKINNKNFRILILIFTVISALTLFFK